MFSRKKLIGFPSFADKSVFCSSATGNITTGHEYGYFGLIGVPLLIGFVKFYLNKAKRKQFKYRANQIIYKLSPQLQNL